MTVASSCRAPVLPGTQKEPPRGSSSFRPVGPVLTTHSPGVPRSPEERTSSIYSENYESEPPTPMHSVGQRTPQAQTTRRSSLSIHLPSSYKNPSPPPSFVPRALQEEIKSVTSSGCQSSVSTRSSSPTDVPQNFPRTCDGRVPFPPTLRSKCCSSSHKKPSPPPSFVLRAMLSVRHPEHLTPLALPRTVKQQNEEEFKRVNSSGCQSDVSTRSSSPTDVPQNSPEPLDGRDTFPSL